MFKVAYEDKELLTFKRNDDEKHEIYQRIKDYERIIEAHKAMSDMNTYVCNFYNDIEENFIR